ncbi:MAG: PEP/pyruvate-binding domain-containing protein [Pirellulales bacterium]
MVGRQPLVFDFWPGGAAGDPARTDLLGGKGASLASLSRAGFPVPAGFTLSTECCDYYQRHERRPPDLETQVAAALERLEARVAARFAAGASPLLLAVRSGAQASMPGMMDTVLNVGMHPGLINAFASPREFWVCYASHLRMLFASIGGTEAEKWLATTRSEKECGSWDVATAQAACLRLLDAWEPCTGKPLPEDPLRRLWLAIDAVMRSWNSPRALAFRRRQPASAGQGTAVNVQAMFQAERAGVLFTRNPHAPAHDESIIEAGWGLGDSVVSGRVTPDRYVWDYRSRKLLAATPGDRPDSRVAWTEQKVIELGDWGQRVEQHFSYPCDVEWAWANGQFAILQARPIQGWEVAREVPGQREAEIERLQRLAGAERVVWVAHNLSETLPDATPFTAQLMQRWLSARGGLGRLYSILGFEPADSDKSILEWIAGRPYVDPRRQASLFFGNFPFIYDPDELVARREILERPPGHWNMDQIDPWLFARLPKLAVIFWRISRTVRRLKHEAIARFEQRVAQAATTFLDRCQAQELPTLSDAQLWDEWLIRRDFVLGELAAESMLPGYLGGLAFVRLDAQLRQIFGDEQGIAIRSRLTAGLLDDIAVAPGRMLEQVARGEETLAAFLERFGHRCVGEMELSRPRWREDSTYLFQRIEHLQRRHARGEASPASSHAAQVAVRHEAEGGLPDLLAQRGASSLYENLCDELHEARMLLPYRELGKYHWLRGYAVLRNISEEWARRWGLGADLYHLTEAEIEEFSLRREEILAQVPRRRWQWQARKLLAFPELIDSRQLSNLVSDQGDSMKALIRGERSAARGEVMMPDAERQEVFAWPARPLSAGSAEGIAVHVTDPQEVDELPHHCVLVCPSTDPAWTPLFVHLRGLIVERGGDLSHGAIVARDMGIPAVACEHALMRIPRGVRVRLDGTNGRVEIVESPT